MGILNASDQMVSTAMNILDSSLSNNFNKFLDETPILVTFYDINDILSTTDTFTGTIDNYIGDDSPIRFNKIENFPVYGLKELVPSIEEVDGGEGLLTMDIEGEVIILPHTIKPTPGSYFIYKFLDTSLTFIVTDFTMASVRSNDYYKLNISMKKIKENDYDKVLDKQVVETFKADLNTIGTNEKCFITSTVFEKIEKINGVIKDLTNKYIDLFHSSHYNSIILVHGLDDTYGVYDPFLTQFISNHSLLDVDKNLKILVNYDTRPTFRSLYNKTLFRNIETKDNRVINDLLFIPTKIQGSRNPFAFYGEDIFFGVDLYEDKYVINPTNIYIDFKLLSNIRNNTIPPDMELFNAMIVRYLNNEDISTLISNDELDSLYNTNLEYDSYYMRIVPVIIYIMKQLVIFMKHK